MFPEWTCQILLRNSGFSILEIFPSLQQDSSLVFLPFLYDYRMVS